MELGLHGKVAWVTGGGGGIGSAIAAVLHAEGCRVAITGRDEERLKTAATAIARGGDGASGGEVLALPADTGDSAEVDAAATRIVAELGGVDILVNCAGAPGGRAHGPLETVSDELLLDDLNTKYAGYLRCARAAVPSMKAAGWGRLIHIGGLSARQSGTYSAGGRNVAIVHLSKTLSDELGPWGITSNVVHPSLTRTPWLDEQFTKDARERGVGVEEIERQAARTHALRRIVDRTEVAHVVAFLASERAAAITGESIAVGGGAQRGVTL